MTDRDPIRLLRLAADELERERFSPRPLAKTRGEEMVESLRAEGHAEFVRSCDQLAQQGTSHSDVARYFGVSRQTLSDWYHYGHSRNKQLPDYATRGVGKLLCVSLSGLVKSG